MSNEYSVEVSEGGPGEGPIHRSALSPDLLLTEPAPGVATLYDLIQYSAKTHGTKNAMGSRTLIDVIEEEKEVTKVVNGAETKELKKWKYFQLSEYEYYSYIEVAEITKAIGAGLVKIGLEKNSKVDIYAATSMNWILVSHGCFTQSLSIVTAYDTLGEDGLLHSINEAEVKAMFTNADLLKSVKNVAGRCSTLEHVIYDGEPQGNILEEIKAAHPNIQFHTLDQIRELGKENPIEPNPPQSDDIACIMYTSGSTGNPKGVILKHSNLIATIAGVDKLLGHIVNSSDTLLAYLPLAHVLEFTVEHSCIFWGVTLGYGSIRTLTDTSVRNCLGDIREFKPSLMTGVPAVWETIRKGVLAKIHAGSPTIQKVFNAAFKAKGWCLSKGLPTKPFDIAVFNKVKQQTGGRLRLALSGGAPISKETQEFLTIALCQILQGYGMTESCGMCSILPPEQFDYGYVGPPVPCIEVKLVDVSEAGYLVTNTPRPQGEIWIRGPCVTSGYYKNEEVTKETLTDDGWLKTGDIGEWTIDGILAIIDRKKNLVKLSHGEYIALEKLESIYKSSVYVSNIIVYGDSYQSRPVAVVCPVEARINALATEKDIQNLGFEELCQNKDIIDSVYQSLIAQAKKAGLKPAELIQAVYLSSDEWTAHNGLMTAAQKLKRKELVDKYQGDINSLYEK